MAPIIVNKKTPVLVFAYSRPIHLKKVIHALQQDPLAYQTPIYIFCDAPKNKSVKNDCEEVLKLAYSTRGFYETHIIERPYNFGLAKSIISGVTEILEKYDRVIVLEDDLVISPYFLKYMNDALTLYENSESVAAIHGYMYPVKKDLPETFFIKGADCWGWATWKRAWEFFNPDSAYLLNKLYEKNLTNEFDLYGAYPYVKMLKNQVKGLNQSWAIRWQASVFIRGMVTLYPARSLIQNIGHDNTGIHSNFTNDFDVDLTKTEIKLEIQPIHESEQGLMAIIDYYRKTRWLPRRLLRHAISVIYKLCSSFIK
jgi:hypothetical protein